MVDSRGPIVSNTDGSDEGRVSSYRIRMSVVVEVVWDAISSGHGGRREVQTSVDDVKSSQYGRCEVKSGRSNTESNSRSMLRM